MFPMEFGFIWVLSFVPLLPTVSSITFAPGYPSFSVAPCCPLGRAQRMLKLLWATVCARPAWVEEERQRGSGELVLVFSPCEGREALFQLCVSLLGLLMSLVLCG